MDTLGPAIKLARLLVDQAVDTKRGMTQGIVNRLLIRLVQRHALTIMRTHILVLFISVQIAGQCRCWIFVNLVNNGVERLKPAAVGLMRWLVKWSHDEV